MVLASFKACPAVPTLEREAEETLHKAALIRLAIERWQAAGQAANTKRIRRRKAVPVSIRARHTPLRASTKGEDEVSAIASLTPPPLESEGVEIEKLKGGCPPTPSCSPSSLLCGDRARKPSRKDSHDK